MFPGLFKSYNIDKQTITHSLSRGTIFYLKLLINLAIMMFPLILPIQPVMAPAKVVPLYSAVSAGFPSPAQDYIEDDINLQDLLIPRPLSTFLIRVKGDSMEGAHIANGSMLVVDRSIKAKSGMIIVAVVNGEFTVKRLVQTSRNWVLHPENPLYKPLVITDDMEFVVWGVVTQVIISPK